MKKYIFIRIVLTVLCQMHLLQAQNNIKMYTFYTKSHVAFKDIWVSSLIDENIEMVIKEFPQECKSGKLFSDGWQAAMLRKVDMVLEAIQANWGDVVIYSDIDVEFFKPISKKIMELMVNKDLVIQRDTPSGMVCAGFFAFRANERTQSLWQGIRNYMITHNERSDQKTLNHLLRKDGNNSTNPYGVVWDYLPTEFLGGATFTGRGWKIGKKLFIPSDVMMLHANWAQGTKNKLALLSYVREVVEKRKARKALVK